MTNRLLVLARIAAALLGGYLFTWGLAACAIAALVAAGTDFHEAEHAVMLLAFIVFLLAFLWSFAGRSLALIWAVLAGGGATMTLAAWLLQRSLLH
ncbi:hypothetical protein [Chitinimonas koreensis]|uniref:hypothetical protein n=1 Tax=Chitinimonas koreensis TaxID=356302 RepID=UPI0005544E21|nr:hypothetical protein [Chitinimonas koreensis]QNM95735.1 iron uptake protein [Chitinimonas koreensis]